MPHTGRSGNHQRARVNPCTLYGFPPGGGATGDPELEGSPDRETGDLCATPGKTQQSQVIGISCRPPWRRYGQKVLSEAYRQARSMAAGSNPALPSRVVIPHLHLLSFSGKGCRARKQPSGKPDRPQMEYWCSGSTAAFQAVRAGSNPVYSSTSLGRGCPFSSQISRSP